MGILNYTSTQLNTMLTALHGDGTSNLEFDGTKFVTTEQEFSNGWKIKETTAPVGLEFTEPV